MIHTPTGTQQLPRSLEEFLVWEPEDGFKYEWNDGELIKFAGMKKKQYFIFSILNKLFVEKGYLSTGTFIAEPDVMLSGIQMRRPDIAYFTDQQINQAREGVDVIPEYVVEVISPTDDAIKIEEKLAEYFKAGVRVVWHVFPENKVVYVYTSRREVKICLEDDVCSAAPILPDFQISVKELLGE
jgi:Uma2 family endonuclease